MTLILIGYWQGEHAPGWPDVTAFIDPTWDEAERADIGAYVGRGIPVKHYMGFSRCRICGKPNGASELSDGTYIWPSGLAHYVGEHSVRLPQQFVDHVRATVERLQDNPVDSDWWRSLTT